MKLKPIILLMSVLSLVGCGSILGPQTKRDIKYYQVSDSQTLNKSFSSCSSYLSNTSIYISPIETVPPYNDYRMYYVTSDYTVNSYAYSQWAIPVSNMVSQAIVGKLVSSCTFRSVSSGSTVSADSYRLITSVRMIRHELNEENKTSQAHLIIGNQLYDIRKARIIDTFVFDMSAPTDGTPLGFVKSSSELMSQYDNKLLDWVKSKALNIN